MIEIQIDHKELESRPEIPYIHRPSYAHSLKHCLQVATNETSGESRVCARALLSAIDGERFPFDASQLELLEPATLESLLNVLRLRSLGTPLPRLVVDGPTAFVRIAGRWQL